jgi:hypothetical protein
MILCLLPLLTFTHASCLKNTGTLPSSLKINVRNCADVVKTLKDSDRERERERERESCSKQQIKRNTE